MVKWILMIPLFILVACGFAFAESGVTGNEILLGQSCALSGPAEALGIGMRSGLNAYFSKINERGGINGRRIRLISRDDSYEPDKAIVNTRTLIEKENVFLLIGAVGTPTSKAVVPIAEKAKVPFFCPFTGAEFLRNPFKKYVINLRGSYFQETEKLAQYLIDKKKVKNIACFYQNDDYGLAGLEGIQNALAKRKMELVATGSYERNTVAVKSAILSIRKARPDAIVMVGAYKPCAEFIKLSRKTGMGKTVFCNISFVGTEALQQELGDAGEGCIISQVVILPWDDTIPIVQEYIDDMKKYQPEAKIGFVSLEGYMAGKLFCAVSESVEGDLTRENFLSAIEKKKEFDLGGVVLQFGPGDHQGMDEVFLTIIKGGKIVSIEG